MRQIRYLTNVVTLDLAPERCNGCGACVQVCPHAVFVVQAHKASIVERDACMECGACVANCPEDALDVQPGVGCAFTVIKSFFRRAEPPERRVAGRATET